MHLFRNVDFLVVPCSIEYESFVFFLPIPLFPFYQLMLHGARENMNQSPIVMYFDRHAVSDLINRTVMQNMKFVSNEVFS